VSLADAEPALASELAETRLRIDRRFGFRLGRPARPLTAAPLAEAYDSGAD
jgi:hypothetical protein